MTEFWIFFEKGIRHILNPNSYDHLLFLVAVAIPYTFKDWKKLLLLATIFTLGHTVALLLAIYNIVIIKVNLAEILLPITILIIAFFNLFTSGKSSKNEGISVISTLILFFGIVHGLSFAGRFNDFSIASKKSKLIPALELSLGIEAAQLMVFFILLVISYIVQTVFRFSKRDWTLVMSSFIIGVVLPMILTTTNWFTNK